MKSNWLFFKLKVPFFSYWASSAYYRVNDLNIHQELRSGITFSLHISNWLDFWYCSINIGWSNITSIMPDISGIHNPTVSLMLHTYRLSNMAPWLVLRMLVVFGAYHVLYIKYMSWVLLLCTHNSIVNCCFYFQSLDWWGKLCHGNQRYR